MLRDAEHFNCVLANPAAPGCKGEGRDTPALGILCCRRAAKPERSCVEAAQNSSKVVPNRRAAKTPCPGSTIQREDGQDMKGPGPGAEALLSFGTGWDLRLGEGLKSPGFAQKP